MRKSLFLFVMIAACTQPKSAQRGSEKSGATTTADATTGTDQTQSTNTPDNSNEIGTSTPAPTPTPTGVAAAVEAGSLDVQWIHGSTNCNQDNNPPIQVHAYNKNLTILRQNKCINYEGPFIYLIFGSQKALLIDSGATASAATFPIRTTVENLLVEHYGAAQRAQIQLVVAHSHAHGDHRAADAQFNGQAGTTVVGTTQAAVATFFGITNWPETVADYDLGGRVLKIIPIPGHESSHVSYYDAQTGILFSGDTLYPGRLYVDDWTAYRASVSRLRTFADPKTITHVLGAHIEMTKTAGQDYPIGTTFQPNEHVLRLTKDNLIQLDTEVKNIGPQPARKVLDEFIIDP